MSAVVRRAVLALAVTTFLLPCAAAHAAPSAGVLAPVSQCQGIIDSGAKSAKFLVRWADLQPDAPGAAAVTYKDTLIDDYSHCFHRLKLAGVSVYVAIFGTPAWANGGQGPSVPPDAAGVAQYGKLLQKLSTYVEGPSPHNWFNVVSGYMIWNEADGPTFWQNPSAAAYVPLLKAGWAGVQAGNASAPSAESLRAKVGFTPLTGGNEAYLAAAYAAEPKLNDYFDAVPVDMDTACNLASPYEYYRDGTTGPIGQTSFLGYREVHQLLAAKGKGDAPLWMEFGWSTSKGRCDQGASTGLKPGGVSEADQALYLRQAHHCLNEDPYVTHAWWFYLQDNLSNALETDRYFGLLHQDGAAKPAMAAFGDLLAGNDTLAGQACGDFTAPSVSIVSPGDGTAYNGTIALIAKATDASGVRAVTIDVDGNRIYSYNAGEGKAFPADQSFGDPSKQWFGARDLKPGRHTILASARDIWGNVGTTTRVVTKVDPATLKGRAKIQLRGTSIPRRVRTRTYTIGGTIVANTVTLASGEAVTGPLLGIIPQGKVRVSWQYWRVKKGKRSAWVQLHGNGGYANGSLAYKPFSFTQKLVYRGRWRVQVQYLATKPFSSTRTKYYSFTAR